jgi:hypothetical protein
VSETITIGSGTETILGTLAAAQAYVEMMPGDRYEAWDEATETQQKKTLVAAVRYLNGLAWSEDYDTLAERDAVTAFQEAQYELAVLIFEDSEVTDEADQGSNIQSLKAGSAGITFHNPTTKGAPKLPPVLMRLVGSYLAATQTSGPQGGTGQSGNCRNPFSDCSDTDRKEPY